MSTSEASLRLGKDQLKAMHDARRTHDREFTRAARAAIREGDWTEVEDMRDRSDQAWVDFERVADELLRARP